MKPRSTLFDPLSGIGSAPTGRAGGRMSWGPGGISAVHPAAAAVSLVQAMPDRLVRIPGLARARVELSPRAPVQRTISPIQGSPLADALIAGSRKPVADILQDLARRDHLKIVLGPMPASTLTIRLGAVHSEAALKGVAAMAGLGTRRQGGVWYVASPEWIAQAFPEKQYTEVAVTEPGHAAEIVPVLRKIMAETALVEAIGTDRIVIRAGMDDLEAASNVLSAASREGSKLASATITLDPPEGPESALVRQVGSAGIAGLQVVPGEGAAFTLKGAPRGVAAGLRLYLAARDSAVPPSASVARK